MMWCDVKLAQQPRMTWLPSTNHLLAETVSHLKKLFNIVKALTEQLPAPFVSQNTYIGRMFSMVVWVKSVKLMWLNSLIFTINEMFLPSGLLSVFNFLTDLSNACWSASEAIRLTSEVKMQSNPLLKTRNIGKQEIHSVELRVCPMQLFHFWSCDVHPVQNLLLCTKLHENRMIFCWDMAIYWFSKWRPSAILELFYHHTRPPTKSLLLTVAACQISCQSDTQIWRYSYLNFSHFTWNAYSGPQKSGCWGVWTRKCDYSSSRPRKAHACIIRVF